MKIKDYVDLDSEIKAKLRKTATFSPPGYILPNDQKDQRSPFEEEKLGLFLPEATKVMKGDIYRPTVARIYLSSICLHNCSGCFFGKDRKSGDAILSSGNFGKLLHGLHSLKIKLIDLTGGGEPTLYPEFITFVRMCMKGEFKLALLSNGTWTDRELTDLLVEGFSFIRVNLDASSGEVYDRIHHPPVRGEFQKILNNLEKIVSEREKRKSSLIVGAKVSLNQANMNYIEETINLAKDLGINYIRFHIRTNDLEAILPEQVKNVNKLLQELKNRYHSFLVYGEFEEKETQDRCWISNLQLTIDPKGDIYPCPHFTEQTDATCLGNIFNQPDDKQWFSSEHNNEIAYMAKKACSNRNCRWHRYDKLIHRMVKTG